MKQILTIPLYAQEMIDEYANLRLGGKKVTCPYFMNYKKERAGLRALIGKGDPGEIEKEVMVWAKLRDFDLERASPAKIREFMTDSHIGVDCSGFVVHVLNFWLRSEGKKRLDYYLTYKDNRIIMRIRRTIRTVENIGANTLTSEENCTKITRLNEVQPGDFIRSKAKVKNSHHIMLITKVVKNDGKVAEIEFTHSRKSDDEGSGIRRETIKVLDPKLPLEKQDWPKDRNAASMLDGYVVDIKDNGIRRLKGVKLDYLTEEQ